MSKTYGLSDLNTKTGVEMHVGLIKKILLTNVSMVSESLFYNLLIMIFLEFLFTFKK